MADNQTNETPVRDEFENPPAGPIGLHRGQRSWLARFLPFLITLIVAVALAAGTWLWMSGKGRELLSGSTTASTSTSQSSGTSSSSSSKKSTSTDSSDASDSSSSDSTDSSSDSSTSSDSSSDSTDASKSDTSSSDSDSSSTSAAEKADTSKSVIVYNGLSTNVTGFAGTKAATLKSAGYTNVSARNPSGTKPSANVVWYKTAADEATAKDVASKLGISTVTQASTISSSVAVMYVTQ